MSQVKPDFTYFPPLKNHNPWDCGWGGLTVKENSQSVADLMRLLGTDNYPFISIPVNKYTKDNKDIYEFLVPGISKDKLTVSRDKNVLVVSVKESNSVAANSKHILNQYKILHDKSHSITLDNSSVVESVKLKDGVLTIHVATTAPQPQIFEIE